MITLTNYDSTNGDAYQILFDGVDTFKVYNSSNVDVTETLNTSGVIKENKGFWVDIFGEKLADIAMLHYGLSPYDKYLKRKF